MNKSISSSNLITIDMSALPRSVRDSIEHLCKVYPAMYVKKVEPKVEVKRKPALRLRYFRYRTPDGTVNLKGGYTVEYMVDDHKVIKYRIAKCSMEDLFNRKTGRAMVAIKPWKTCTEPMSYQEFDDAVKGSMRGFKNMYAEKVQAGHLKQIRKLKAEYDAIDRMTVA